MADKDIHTDDELKSDTNIEDISGEDVSPEDVEQNVEANTTESPDTSSSNADAEPDWKDKYLRLHADWDNYRKRMEVERADERVRATEKLMSDILPLIDDFARTIDYAEKNGEGNLLEGVKAVSTKLDSVLSKHGLIEIDPAGKPFDALTCQAVGTVEDSSVFDETVKEVYQKGYSLGRKVIRPAMVVITTGGEKRSPEDECEEKSEKEDDE